MNIEKRGPTTVQISRMVGAALRAMAAERGYPTVDALIYNLLEEYADRSDPPVDLPGLTWKHGFTADKWQRKSIARWESWAPSRRVWVTTGGEA